MLLVALCCCFCICSSSRLQSLLAAFRRAVLFAGPACVWGLLWPVWVTCSMLLAPSCGRVLKLVNLFWIYKSPAAKNLSCFPDVGPRAHFVICHSPVDSGMFSEGTPCLPELVLSPALRSPHRKPAAAGRFP